MELKDCLQILRDIKDVAFATVDDRGMPYKIRQEHCLHCGLCYEECPTGAIIKMGGTEC